MLIATEWCWNPETVTAIGTVLSALATALVGIFAIRPAVKAARAAGEAYLLESQPLLVFEQPPTTADAVAAIGVGEMLFRLDLRRDDSQSSGFAIHGASGLIPSWVDLGAQHYFRITNVGRTAAVDIQITVLTRVHDVETSRVITFTTLPVSASALISLSEGFSNWNSSVHFEDATSENRKSHRREPVDIVGRTSMAFVSGGTTRPATPEEIERFERMQRPEPGP